MKIKYLIGAAAIFASSAFAAQAATAVFDMKQSQLGGIRSAYSSVSGSDALSIGSTRFRGANVSGNYGKIKRSGKKGLGIKGKRKAGKRDNKKIDGKGRNEMVVLDFGKDVSLNSITFGGVKKKSNAKFDLFMYDGTSWTRVAANLNKDGDGRRQTFTFSQTYTGAVYGIGARSNKAAFNLLDVKASSPDAAPGQGVPQISAVPLPAGGLLLLGGLAALGFARRKKRS